MREVATLLKGRTIGFIGYGNQGRAQALNLRDSGIERILVGNRRDSYQDQITKDGFTALPISEVARQADILFILIPDEVAPDVYEREIGPHLKRSTVLVFASGYNITYKHIAPPAQSDVILVAPRMIGEGVRDRYCANLPVPFFVGVARDAGGHAAELARQLAFTLGATSDVMIETSFDDETYLDLLSEQAIWPLIFGVFNAAYEVAQEAGIPPDATLLELYISGEPGEIMRRAAERGMIGQLPIHSRTSQYGQLVGIKEIGTDPMKETIRSVLKNQIMNGRFDEEWTKFRDQADGPLASLYDWAKRLPLVQHEQSLLARIQAE